MMRYLVPLNNGIWYDQLRREGVSLMLLVRARTTPELRRERENSQET